MTNWISLEALAKKLELPLEEIILETFFLVDSGKTQQDDFFLINKRPAADVDRERRWRRLQDPNSKPGLLDRYNILRDPKVILPILTSEEAKNLQIVVHEIRFYGNRDFTEWRKVNGLGRLNAVCALLGLKSAAENSLENTFGRAVKMFGEDRVKEKIVASLEKLENPHVLEATAKNTIDEPKFESEIKPEIPVASVEPRINTPPSVKSRDSSSKLAKQSHIVSVIHKINSTNGSSFRGHVRNEKGQVVQSRLVDELHKPLSRKEYGIMEDGYSRITLERIIKEVFKRGQLSFLE